MDTESRIIVALDYPTFEQALALADLIGPDVAAFKLGNELAEAEGPGAFGCVKALSAKGGNTFRDSKLHDIPRTVEAAAARLVQPGVFMFNMMCQGGAAMMAAGKAAAVKRAQELGIPAPLALGVTVLTSLDYEQLVEMEDLRHYPFPMTFTAETIAEEKIKAVQRKVVIYARLAQKAGLDGVVCSAQEARIVREACGAGFKTVCPGIRSKNAPPDDQKRTMTVAEAAAAGVDYFVIGRPITQAKDPKAAVVQFNREAAEARGT